MWCDVCVCVTQEVCPSAKGCTIAFFTLCRWYGVFLVRVRVIPDYHPDWVSTSSKAKGPGLFSNIERTGPFRKRTGPFSEKDRAFFGKGPGLFGNGPGLFRNGPVSARAFLNGISASPPVASGSHGTPRRVLACARGRARGRPEGQRRGGVALPICVALM